MRSPRPNGLSVVSDPERVEASLWRRSRLEGDLASRERLFTRYSLLARSIASRYLRLGRRPRIDRGDVEQFAFEGLLQAMDGFDPLLGVPFSAFARRRIGGNIAHGMSRMSEIGAQLSAKRRLERDRVRELAERDTGDPLERLADLAVDLAIGCMLEDAGVLVAADGSDQREDSFAGLAWRQSQAALADELARLPANEQIVVRHHYQTGLSFAHIAELMRLSRGRISQLHRSAIERLRWRLRHY